MSASNRVYIDFDDVLCETARTLLRIAGEEYGVRLDFERIRSFDIGRAFDLTPPQVARVMDIVHRPATLVGIPPTEGAVAAVASLADAAFDICIVTGRPPATLGACRLWLERHRVPYSSLVFVDKYARGHPDTPEAAALSLAELAQEPFCLAIDDSPEMVLFLARAMPIPVMLFDRPWNTDATWPDGLPGRPIRCRGWPEVLARLPAPASRRTGG